MQHAGKRFTVSHRVEKICDTVSGGPPNSRRMRRHGDPRRPALRRLRPRRLPGGLPPVLEGVVAAPRRRRQPARGGSRREGSPNSRSSRAAATRRCASSTGPRPRSTAARRPTHCARPSRMSNFDLRQYVRECHLGQHRPRAPAARRPARAFGGCSVAALHLTDYVPRRNKGDAGQDRSRSTTCSRVTWCEVRSPEEITPDAQREGPHARAVVRLGDAAVLRRPLPRAQARRADHRRAQRPDDRDPERLPDPRRCRVQRRAQPRALVLPPRDLSRTGARRGCARSRVADAGGATDGPWIALERRWRNRIAESAPRRPARCDRRHPDLQPGGPPAQRDRRASWRRAIRNFTLIVSDNASDDDTAEVVRSFDDPRVVYRPLRDEHRPRRRTSTA